MQLAARGRPGNQLYRVEVHEVATATDANGQVVQSAPFKWSRENGSVVFPLVSLAGTTAVVASLGRDQCSQLKPGDWVEGCDDVLALREQSGVVRQRRDIRARRRWASGGLPLPDSRFAMQAIGRKIRHGAQLSFESSCRGPSPLCSRIWRCAIHQRRSPANLLQLPPSGLHCRARFLSPNRR